jgi:uncharacterized peroxidase-related enzyme
MSDMLKHGLYMIEEAEATGELVALYDTIKRDFQMPQVPNMLKAIAMSPVALELYVGMMRSFYSNLSLPQSLISMIGFTVAKQSNCTYCAAGNEVLCRTLGVDDDTLNALAENLGEVNPERIRAIIEFALKAAKYPKDLSSEDYERLRNMGISDDEILQIIFAAGIAVFADIVADALKVEVDSAPIEASEK